MANFLLIPHFEMHRVMLDQFEHIIHSEFYDGFYDTPIETNKMHVKFKGTLHALLPRDGYWAIEINIPNFYGSNKNERDKLLNALLLINNQSGVRAPILIKLYENSCSDNAEILTKRTISKNIFDGYFSNEECHLINYTVENVTALGNPMERTQIANNISALFQKLSNLDYMYAIISDEYSQIILTSTDEIYYEGHFYASLESEDN
jgi:hypothetical protein